MTITRWHVVFWSFCMIAGLLIVGCETKKQPFKEIYRAEGIKVVAFNNGLVHVWKKGDCIPSVGIKNGVVLVDRDGGRYCPKND